MYMHACMIYTDSRIQSAFIHTFVSNDSDKVSPLGFFIGVCCHFTPSRHKYFFICNTKTCRMCDGASGPSILVYINFCIFIKMQPFRYMCLHHTEEQYNIEEENFHSIVLSPAKRKCNIYSFQPLANQTREKKMYK